MDQELEISLRDLFVLFRRGLPFALAVAVGAAALTYALSSRTTPDYQASATLLASRPNSTLQGSFGVSLVTAPVIDVTAYRAAATSTPVLYDALRYLGFEEPSTADVRRFESLVDVKVENAQQSSLIRISVHNADPAMAASSANAVAHALLDWDEQRATQSLQTVIDTLESQLRAIDEEIAMSSAAVEAAANQIEGLRSLRVERVNQLNAARALLTSAVGLLEVLEPAVPPLDPVSPRPLKDAALAFVLGGFLVYGLVLLRDALDTRFRNGEDLVRSTGLPVLGEFPRMPPGTRILPREASGYLRTNLTFATSTSHPKILLVTSAGPSQGKTSVACSLSGSFARNDYRTLLIDGDLRRPKVADAFGIADVAASQERRSLSVKAVLEDPAVDGAPASVSLGGGATLDVLPQHGAASSPTELLSRGFADLLNRFKSEYDVIIIDSPPVLPVADALTMAPHTTGVLLAVSLPDTDRRAVGAAIDLLDRIGVRMLGLVATNLDTSSRHAGDYGFGYGYGYGSSDGGPAHMPPSDSGRQSGPPASVPPAGTALAASPSLSLPTSWWSRFWPNVTRPRASRR